MLDLAGTGADPSSRSQFVPGHFTVGAYVLARGHILMVHHRRLDRWLAPGGHIDPEDETLEAAAARELHEETGVAGDLTDIGIFDIDAHPIPASQSEPAHTHFNVGYLFTAAMVAPVAAAEVRAARWVPLGRIAELAPDAALRRVAGKMQAV